jgi:hypothetical protein
MMLCAKHGREIFSTPRKALNKLPPCCGLPEKMLGCK